MYLGKALFVCISGYNKQSVIDGAEKYCQEHGFKIWNNVYKGFRLFKWKWEYKVDLYQPLDFKVEKINNGQIQVTQYIKNERIQRRKNRRTNHCCNSSPGISQLQSMFASSLFYDEIWISSYLFS